MKKPLAIVLLILGGAVTLSFIVLLTAILFFIIALILPVGGEWALYAIITVFLFLASYAFKYPREYFKKKFNLNPVVLIVCICAPSLIAAVTVNIMYTPGMIDNVGFFTGEAAIRFWLIITAVFTFWMIVHAGVAAFKKYRMKKQ